MNEQKVRLALGIISGRRRVEDLNWEHFEMLGYNSYSFGYFGTPPEAEVKMRCEDIIFDALVGEN